MLDNIKKVHLIGIKGTGMSALALALSSLGVEVSGSDAPDSFFLLDEKNFKEAGIIVYPQFSPDNLKDNIDLVVASTSYGDTNIEIQEAKKRNLTVWQYPKMLGYLTKKFRSIAVCGSHGKTTTANLLAYTARANGLPALAIGGPTSQQVLDLPLRQAGIPLNKEPELFIFEADEYQNKLQYYHPHGVILTNIELDHPDFFKTDQEYAKVFSDFIERIPKDGFLIYCTDDEKAGTVASKAKCKTYGYGFSEHAEYKVSENSFPTSLLGRHNQLNATAVVLAARLLGLNNDQIKKSLSGFTGAHRRMQKVSEHPLIIDDYGHHPTEIKATLEALREAYPDRTIWTVFHPHTFTRTQKFLKEFGQSFQNSDHTIVLDIYTSAREQSGSVSAQDVVHEIQKNGRDAIYIPNIQQVAKFLKDKLNDSTLLVTIGAGDVWKIHELITK
ncbi:MAG: UDP-N-acetylmuramate--L-alanine ligase [Candidatus Liptonbacteria bacterium]